MSDLPTAAVVIPCLNEEDAIGPCLRAIFATIERTTLPVNIDRVIVVDNGSTDATAQVAEQAGADVVPEPRRGYGQACLAGVQAATGADLVILMDGDGSDHFEDVAILLAPIIENRADIVIGSRMLGNHDTGSLTPQQIFGNRIAITLFRLLYRVKLTDIGPFRVIGRDTLLQLGMREMTYGWSIEMIGRAVQAGLRLQEVPVNYRARIGGESKVSGNVRASLKAGYRIIGAILRTRWHSGS